MGFPIRRKVFLLTVALSLALIGAAVFISYALYSNRVRRDVEEGCKGAAENMAVELENYHAEFIISIQQQIDQLYQENVAEIEKWSDDFEDLEERNAFFETLTASVFPVRGKLGLSYEKSVFLGNYNNLRAMLNISSTGVGMQDAQVFYLDKQRQYMVHLVDSVASQSPLHHPPGSISEMDEDFITHCLDRDRAEAYTVSDYFSMAACPVRIEGLPAPVYIMFTDNLEEAYSHRQGFMWTVALVLLGSTALLALVYLLFVDRFVAKNIEKLSAATESFTAQMEAETSLQPVPAQVKTRDELGALSDRLDLMQNKLVEYVETIGEKSAREESMRAELNLAARIQREALPPSGFEAGIFRIDSFLKPAKEVGGDLYDYFLVDEDHLFFVVADVSGKGVPAALFMMRGKELIKAHAGAGHSPGEIAEAVNKELCKGNEEGLFITAFFGLAELSTGRLLYARAGHEQPFLMRGGKAKQISEESNFMLGLFDNFDFAEDSLVLEAGDRLLVFTDGLNEGVNPRQEAFGYERIRVVLEESRGNALPELVEALTRFSEGEEQFDDVTLLQLTVRGGDSCPPPDAGEGGSPPQAVVGGGYLHPTPTWTFSPPSFSDITTVCDELHDLLPDVSPEALAQLCMVTDEIMNNCISYAYKGVAKPRLQITLERTEEAACLSFADNGNPYNPLASDSDDHLEKDILTRGAGGMGIPFIKSFADDVRYEYKDGENRLRVEKRIIAPESDKSG